MGEPLRSSVGALGPEAVMAWAGSGAAGGSDTGALLTVTTRAPRAGGGKGCLATGWSKASRWCGACARARCSALGRAQIGPEASARTTIGQGWSGFWLDDGRDAAGAGVKGGRGAGGRWRLLTTTRVRRRPSAREHVRCARGNSRASSVARGWHGQRKGQGELSRQGRGMAKVKWAEPKGRKGRIARWFKWKFESEI